MNKDAVLYYASNEQEKMFLSKIFDNYLKTYEKRFHTFSDFLDVTKLSLIEKAFGNSDDVILKLYGGYEGAERKISAFLIEDTVEFPISVLEVQHREIEKLSHRDFLGALMSLGIKRETIGDIILEESCRIVVLNHVAEYIRLNLNKVANKNVVVDYFKGNIITKQEKFVLEIHTISSFRLDNVIASVYHLSRSNSAKLIQTGRASVNFKECLSSDFKLKEGDTISLKGYGRILLNKDKGISKKGKNILEIKKLI